MKCLKQHKKIYLLDVAIFSAAVADFKIKEKKNEKMKKQDI